MSDFPPLAGPAGEPALELATPPASPSQAPATASEQTLPSPAAWLPPACPAATDSCEAALAPASLALRRMNLVACGGLVTPMCQAPAPAMRQACAAGGGGAAGHMRPAPIQGAAPAGAPTQTPAGQVMQALMRPVTGSGGALAQPAQPAQPVCRASHLKTAVFDPKLCWSHQKWSACLLWQSGQGD